MKTILVVIALCLSVVGQAAYSGSGSYWGSAVYSSTINAASCSQANVQTAINSASDGDTVAVPATSCTWATPVAFCKSITLQGAGVGSTVITVNTGTGWENDGIVVDSCSGKRIRITGITFHNQSSDSFGMLMFTGGTGLSLRLDHNTFDAAGTYGRAFSFRVPCISPGCVADHNTFTDQGFIIESLYPGESNAGDHAWAGSTPFETINAFYFENNTITYPSYATHPTDIDCDNGGSYVFRYNSESGNAVGNHGYDSVYNGCVEMDVYNNVLNGNGTAFIGIQSRGGTGVWYDNLIQGTYTGYRMGITNDRSTSAYTAGIHDHCDGTGTEDQNSSPTGTYHGWHCYEQIGMGSPAASFMSYPLYEWDNCITTVGCMAGGGGSSGNNSLGAGTHWVSPTGAAAWGSCSGSTPLSGTSACALATANSNAAAGDVVYLRGGTYTVNSAYGSAIGPVHSGTGAGANRIVFAAYMGETPVLTQANTSNAMIGLALHGVSWVQVTGIAFQNFTYYFAFLDAGSSYNEISYNSFTEAAGYESPGAGFVIGGFDGSSGWSTHNWVHHNYISKKQATDPCGEAIDLVRIGNAESSPVSSDNYNTVENNYLEYGGHSTLMTYGKYSVVKNNIAHNEPWISGCTNSSPTTGNQPIYVNTAYNGLYGHRNFDIGDQDPVNNDYALVEGNRLGFASTNPGNGGSTNIDLESPANIVRYNFIYGGMDSGLYFKWGNISGAGTGGAKNHVYNNTIYHNGYGWNPDPYGHLNVTYNGQGIAQFTYSGNTLNVVKNNIVYGNSQGDICALGWTDSNSCTALSIDTVTNNWLTTNGDPKFTNADLTAPTSQNLFSAVHGYTATAIPDLTLQSSSSAIDGGTYLTQANGSGTGSTTLVVNDALYFQDGTWGSDLARGVTFSPDWIAIGTVTNTVQISSVNYATNTITLASPATWSNGAHIWLYKKSDGAVVLSGAAPDYGASEYGANDQVTATVYQSYGGGTDYTSQHIVQNRDYYDQAAGFSGASGVGSGTLASRPSTCTAKVAYWGTDTNTLYQCSATNTWTTYYTPFTYPHPLQGPTP